MAAAPAKNAKASSTVKTIPVAAKSIDFQAQLPNEKLAALLNSLESNEEDSTKIVHISSAYDHEGADLIALEAAIFAATQERKDVLLIDVNPTSRTITQTYGLTPTISLDQLILEGADGDAPLLRIENTSCVYAKLEANEHSANLLYNTRQLKELLSEFRSFYDIIIIHSQNSIKTGVAGILAPLVDHSVIVIEADRTRHQVVKELADSITSNGGTLAGTIMSGRKYYIPRWLYKLFFNSESRD